MQLIINKDDTLGPPPKDLTCPFQIFSILLKLPSLCPNRSLTRSKSAGVNPPFLQILLCLHRSLPLWKGDVFPLSKANLFASLKPHYLFPGSLPPLIILQTHPLPYLLPFCQHTYKSPPYLKIILSLSLWRLGPFYHLFTSSLPTAKSPTLWLLLR